MSKVFIGLTDVASCIDDFKVGFDRIGIDTLSVAVHNRKNPIIRTKADYIIDLSFFSKFDNVLTRFFRAVYLKIYLRYLWRKATKECDIFLFIWSTFKYDFSDVKVLREKGKHVVFYHVGTDIRWTPAMSQDFLSKGVDPYEYAPEGNPKRSLVQKLQRLRTSEKYASLIYTIPGAAQLSLRPYKYYHVPINLQTIRENASQRKKPLVVHSPSKSALKGTKYVTAAVEELREEGFDFDFRLMEKLPYEQALELYEDADILIGQMFSPQGGKQEREALAAGCVVLSSFKKEYIFSKEKFNTEDDDNWVTKCPIVDVRPDSLADVLRKIVPDVELREKIARKGRPYVEEYHKAEAITKDIMESIHGRSRTYDIVPTFFQQEYEPEQDLVHIFNQFTQFVSECNWYQNEAALDRKGLTF